jgi:hypothetical protein
MGQIAWLVGASIAAVVAVIFLFGRTGWFWLTDLLFKIPFIGRIDRLANDESKADGGWLTAEVNLGDAYAVHCNYLTKAEFEQLSTYLKKCGDNGRSTRPLYLTAVIFGLILAEGLGFSYLLSSAMAMESSERVREYLTLAIVMVVSGVMFFIVERAGQQLYKTNTIRQNFKDYISFTIRNSDSKDDKPSFQTRRVSLDDVQTIDDDLPPPVQFGNRVLSAASDRGSYAWFLVALVLIAAIAWLSTMMRIESLQAAATSTATSFFGGGNNAGTGSAAQAALSSFWLLAVIFVATQLLGIAEGYQYCFCGKDSKEAYRKTEGASNYASYLEKYEHRIQVAESRLTTLRNKWQQKWGDKPDDQRFIDYLKQRQRQKDAISI